jgi:hypothetical protein
MEIKLKQRTLQDQIIKLRVDMSLLEIRIKKLEEQK